MDILTEMSMVQALLFCAAFTIHRTGATLARLGAPVIPFGTLGSSYLEPEDTVRKQGGRLGDSLLPVTFPCSLLIVLECIYLLLFPQQIASMFSSRDTLQIFTKDRKSQGPQTISASYLEKNKGLQWPCWTWRQEKTIRRKA